MQPVLQADEDQWGATAVGGRRAGPRRILRLLFAGLLAVMLVAGVLGAGAVFYGSSRMQRVEVAGLQSSRPLHVLVVGSDSRAGLTLDQRAELSTGTAGGERADTIFIMTVERGRVALLAFPRDLYVTRCDGSRGRINTAVTVGGPGCLVQTVTELSGIPVSHFLTVHFLGFRDVVDAVGGVRVCLERPIEDEKAGIDLPVGCQRLDGREALGFVRVRRIDDDLHRIRRQQQFLQALAAEITSPSTLLHPPRLYRLAGRLGGALTADADLSTMGLLRLAVGMRGLAGGKAVTHTVPTSATSIGGAALLRPRKEEAAELFARFRDGSILVASTLQPNDLEVAVLNGSGLNGLARRTAEALQARGFKVVRTGDADPVETTTVRYPPGGHEGAAVVARELPAEVRVEEDPEVQVVTLVLGPDLAKR